MRLLCLSLLLFLSATSPCVASSLRGTADSFSYDARAGLVMLEGNVFVEAKGFRVSSDVAIFEERSGALSLSGDVLVSAAFGQARASFARYDPSADLLILEGEALVSRDALILEAGRLALVGSDDVRASGDVRLELKEGKQSVLARAGFLSASGGRVDMSGGVRLEDSSRGLEASSSSAQLWLGEGGRVERAVMTGEVSVKGIFEGGVVSATAGRADYDVRREILKLEGNVVISSSRGTLRARVASLDLKSGAVRGFGGRTSVGLE